MIDISHSYLRALTITITDRAHCEIEEPFSEVLCVASVLASLAPDQPVAQLLVRLDVGVRIVGLVLHP